MSFEIRRGDRLDIPWLLGQLKLFSRFYKTKKSLYGDQEYATKGITTIVEDHLVLIAEKKIGNTYKPVGFIAGIYTPHIYNPKIKVLAESFWWVTEEYRGSRAGLLLLNEFTKFGKETADWVVFTLEKDSPVNDKCLTKRGFKLHERSFLLEVD